MKTLIIYIIIINILSFLVSGFDKTAAIYNWRRIPEKTLFLLQQ